MAEWSTNGHAGYLGELDGELWGRAQEYAQEEVGTREIILEELQTSLRNSAPGIPTDEILLLRFLRACRFKLRQTIDSVKAFYHCKASNPELLEPLSSQETRDIVRSGLIGVLPGRDVQGGRVLYVKIGLWEPEETPMVNLFRLAISIQLKLIQDPETQIGGLRTLEDMEGLEWKHVKHLSIPDMRKVSNVYETGFPARFEGLHNMGDSPLIDSLYTLVKPYASPRLRTRNYFHGDAYDELHEFIPQTSLPERYGGTVTEKQIQDYTMKLMFDNTGDDFGDGVLMEVIRIAPRIEEVEKDEEEEEEEKEEVREEEQAEEDELTESTTVTYLDSNYAPL